MTAVIHSFPLLAESTRAAAGANELYALFCRESMCVDEFAAAALRDRTLLGSHASMHTIAATKDPGKKLQKLHQSLIASAQLCQKARVFLDTQAPTPTPAPARGGARSHCRRRRHGTAAHHPENLFVTTPSC